MCLFSDFLCWSRSLARFSPVRFTHGLFFTDFIYRLYPLPGYLVYLICCYIIKEIISFLGLRVWVKRLAMMNQRMCRDFLTKIVGLFVSSKNIYIYFDIIFTYYLYLNTICGDGKSLRDNQAWDFFMVISDECESCQHSVSNVAA